MALVWSFVDKFGQQIIYFVSGVILANLLMPTDYGKVGLLALFTALSNILIDSGFSSALIRKKDATDSDLSTIFYFNIVLSITFYLALFFAAPLLANFYNIPDLTSIARVIFLAIVFNAFGLIQQTLMFKNIHFTAFARINIIALTTASVAAIAVATMGYGVWALVTQTVGIAVVKSILLWVNSNWRPIRVFRFKSIKEFAAYSSNLLFTGILNTIFNNIYPLLIGKGFSTAAVGFYTQANKFHEIPSQLIGNIFRSVAFPTLSSINSDRVRLIRVFRSYMRTTSFFIFPIMCLMIVIAKPLIILLITEKWSASIPMLQIVSIAGMFSPLIILYYDLYNAIGRSDINFKMEIVKKCFLVVSICTFFYFDCTIIALIWLWVIYSFLSFMATAIISHYKIGYKITTALKDISPYALIAAISGSAAYAITLYIDNNFALIILQVVTFIAIYIALSITLKLRAWLECYHLAKTKIFKR